MDDDNKSRGYGYLQFESKESADKCFNEVTALNNGGQKFTVLDKEVDVCKFLRKRERPDNKNNLYIKNIPKLSKEDIEKKIENYFHQEWRRNQKSRGWILKRNRKSLLFCVIH
jgi:RNA recognition motif-containing protein